MEKNQDILEKFLNIFWHFTDQTPNGLINDMFIDYYRYCCWQDNEYYILWNVNLVLLDCVLMVMYFLRCLQSSVFLWKIGIIIKWRLFSWVILCLVNVNHVIHFPTKKKNMRPNKVSASHLINAYFQTECENNERNALCKLLTFTNCPVFAQQKYW